jgi:hypothetical protein
MEGWELWCEVKKEKRALVLISLSRHKHATLPRTWDLCHEAHAAYHPAVQSRGDGNATRDDGPHPVNVGCQPMGRSTPECTASIRPSCWGEQVSCFSHTRPQPPGCDSLPSPCIGLYFKWVAGVHGGRSLHQEEDPVRGLVRFVMACFCFVLRNSHGGFGCM